MKSYSRDDTWPKETVKLCNTLLGPYAPHPQAKKISLSLIHYKAGYIDIYIGLGRAYVQH